MVEQYLDDIKRITWNLYKKYKLNIYFDYEEVLNEVVVYILKTVKYYDETKAKFTSFLFMQINNRCKRLIEEVNYKSSILNYNENLTISIHNESYGDVEENANSLNEILSDNINIENEFLQNENINQIIEMFKDDEIKLNIIILMLKGYKRNEISKMLNINTRHFDYQRNLIKKELIKVGV